jgi:hypothetical protein
MLQLIAFARFEIGGVESAGPLLVVAGLAGVGLVVDAAIRGWRSWRVTRTVIGSWRRSASPFALAAWRGRAWLIRRRFPVVGVVGITHPELYLATQVARACTPDELAAIAAHEAAHVRCGDNLMRALFNITPGAFWCARLASDLERDWMAAAEEAADLRARASASPIDLASALTKVARMAATASAGPHVGSALIGISALDQRVRRLLEPARRHRPGWAWAPTLLVAVAAAIMLTSSAGLEPLHEMFELLVRRP